MPRPPYGKQEKPVGSHELKHVLQGEKEHGAGSATPKDRDARPSPSLLAGHSVIDNSKDGSYIAGKRASPPRKPRDSTGGVGARARLSKMASLTWDTLSALTSLPPSPTETVATIPNSSRHLSASCLNGTAAKHTLIQNWQRGTGSTLYPLLSPTPSFYSPPGAFPTGRNAKDSRLVAQISLVQKLIFAAVAGVIALFVLVNAFFGASSTYTELDTAARTTAERMEALHPILDDKLESCYVYTAVILHILIDILSWAVAHMVSIVSGGTALLVACMFARLRLEE